MSTIFYEPFSSYEYHFDNSSGHNACSVWLIPSSTTAVKDGAVRTLKPKMDVHENAETNTVTATFEFPGFKKEDIHIELHNSKLFVTAESKISQDHEEKGYAIRERRNGKFSRTLQLPQGVKDEEINASMEDGILTVTFPKTTSEQERKEITIA